MENNKIPFLNEVFFRHVYQFKQRKIALQNCANEQFMKAIRKKRTENKIIYSSQMQIANIWLSQSAILKTA